MHDLFILSVQLCRPFGCKFLLLLRKLIARTHVKIELTKTNEHIETFLLLATQSAALPPVSDCKLSPSDCSALSFSRSSRSFLRRTRSFFISSVSLALISALTRSRSAATAASSLESSPESAFLDPPSPPPRGASPWRIGCSVCSSK